MNPKHDINDRPKPRRDGTNTQFDNAFSQNGVSEPGQLELVNKPA